jgi:diguanylate cyclase (GGDEF)-like protein/PAS domain S-box-containing protein
MMVWKRMPSPYTIGFVLLMCIAAGEALFLAALVQQQKMDATLSNLGAPQRMRTQRIAFLAEESIAPGLSPAERSELTKSIDTIIATQHTLDDNTTTRLGALLPDGTTDLERGVERYATAAAAVLANPKGARAANAYLLANRLPLLKALDAAVDGRREQSEARKRLLWTSIAVLLGLMALLVIVAWRFVVTPLERHLANNREQLRSLFEDNPDSVTTYALNGTLVNANAAAATLSGRAQADLLGQTFAGRIAEELRPEAFLAFARSARGGVEKLETTVVRADGTRIDTSVSLLPSIVDGRIDGVCAIARDVTQERRAERALVEQAKRIRELYLVAASGGASSDEQVLRALEVGCSRMGLEWGFVAQVESAVATIIASVGNGTYATGDSVRVEKSLLRQTLASEDVVVVDDPGKDPVAADPAARSGKLGTFVAVPIEIDSKKFGAVCFASARKRDDPLSESDRDFIRLIGALIGVALERAQAKVRLDAMAFSDPLTGLPNRASLDASIENLIANARRSEDRFAVHFLDLDDFKNVNDERGHAVGDELLQVVAQRLRGAIRPSDIAARLGGDEFIILQPGATSPSDAGELAAKVIAAINEPLSIGGAPVSVGASIGISFFPADGIDVVTLFSNADRALYRAKASGRGRHFCATEAANR